MKRRKKLTKEPTRAFGVSTVTPAQAAARARQRRRAEEKRVAERRVCRVCGCTQLRACVVGGEPCAWVADNLCSACV